MDEPDDAPSDSDGVGSVSASRTKASGDCPSGPPGTGPGSCSGSPGLHPELRARLQRLGIGLGGDAQRQGSGIDLAAGIGSSCPAEYRRPAAALGSSGSDRFAAGASIGEAGAGEDVIGESCAPGRPPTMPGGLSAVAAIAASLEVSPVDDKEQTKGKDKKDGLDDLLLQLDDLDARSKALQKSATNDAEADAQRAARRARKAARAAESSSPREPGGAQASAVSADTMAEAIVKQHPLKGLRLGVADSGGGSEFRRGHRQGRERPPVAPGTPCGRRDSGTPRRNASNATSISSVAIASSIATLPYPASPSSARGTRSHSQRGEKGSRLKLPELKASASAPGCLQARRAVA